MSVSLVVLTSALVSQMGAPSTQNLPPDHPPINGSAGAPAAGSSAAPPMARPPPADAELLRQLDALGGLSEAGKSFEAATGAGRLFASRGRYTEATKYLSEAAALAEPVRTFFLAQRSKVKGALPDAAAVGCAASESTTLSDLFARAKAKTSPGDAAACARAALGPALAAAELHARALHFSGQSAQALTELEKWTAVEPGRPDLLYTRGMLRFDARPDDVQALGASQKDLQAFVEAVPGQDPRVPGVRRILARISEALPLGGVSALDRKQAKEQLATVQSRMGSAGAGAPMAGGMPPGHPPIGADAPGVAPVSPEMAEAVRNTEMTPEMVEGMGKLVEEGEEHLARGRYEDALDVYKRVVPFQPNNGRAKAGMAWALVGMGKPTAERIWSVAVQSDPSAVDRLGETLRKKGDEQGARNLWKRLAGSSPEYAAKAGLSLKIK